MKYKSRRVIFVSLLVSLATVIFYYQSYIVETPSLVEQDLKNVTHELPKKPAIATEELEKLAVKGRAPKTGYTREQFTQGWNEASGCDTRNVILKRDLRDIIISDDNCTVLKGRLNDPYTGSTVPFFRGLQTSQAVQIDHIVALSDAWQKGAQQKTYDVRNYFANDPLNLLAVEGESNRSKGDGDAATWLPPNKPYRCAYIARQIAVKVKYDLWLTPAEKDAMKRILAKCPEQVLPAENV